ncbi:MAG: magnesium transporter [Deltaproteobacteria bacterium]|nr:magnesium transporter [Deltaproteobacteria bacterium]
MRLASLIAPELRALLSEQPEAIGGLLDEFHPEDVADLVAELDDERAAALLQHLPNEYAAQVFERLDDQRREELATRLGMDETARIVVEMGADDRADFFSQLPPAVGAILLVELERVDPEVAEDVETLAAWPEASAGGLMTTDYLSISPHLDVGDAIAEIRRRAGEAETVDIVFVVDDGNRLAGVLSLRQMLIAEAKERIADVMSTHVISVPPEMDQEDVARKLAKYDFHAIPVVGADGHLLGVITADDVLDVLTEEHGEDVQRMAAVAPMAEGYLDATTSTVWKKRVPWLVVLFVGEFLSGTAMRAHDDVLAAVGQLSYYVPLLVSSGGNSGSQSSTLVIRALATGAIETRDWWRVLLRETSQGLLLGVTLAALGFGRAMLAGDGPRFALLISLTVVGLVLMGCVVGSMLPMLLHRLRVDPATSSAPFIATLVDALGIVLYLTLARLILADVLAGAAAG